MMPSIESQVTHAAGLISRANGGGKRSAKMVNFKQLPKSQLWIVSIQIWRG